jgi:hypothetical protein
MILPTVFIRAADVATHRKKQVKTVYNLNYGYLHSFRATVLQNSFISIQDS